MDIMRRNGFDIQEAPDGQLRLAAVPFSRNITFGARDVLELAHLLLDGGPALQAPEGLRANMLTSQTLRPSRCACAAHSSAAAEQGC